jgi:hypothetical protein
MARCVASRVLLIIISFTFLMYFDKMSFSQACRTFASNQTIVTVLVVRLWQLVLLANASEYAPSRIPIPDIDPSQPILVGPGQVALTLQRRPYTSLQRRKPRTDQHSSRHVVKAALSMSQTGVHCTALHLSPVLTAPPLPCYSDA